LLLQLLQPLHNFFTALAAVGLRTQHLPQKQEVAAGQQAAPSEINDAGLAVAAA
jgi:hypothetical protein